VGTQEDPGLHAPNRLTHSPASMFELRSRPRALSRSRLRTSSGWPCSPRPPGCTEGAAGSVCRLFRACCAQAVNARHFRRAGASHATAPQLALREFRSAPSRALAPGAPRPRRQCAHPRCLGMIAEPADPPGAMTLRGGGQRGPTAWWPADNQHRQVEHLAAYVRAASSVVASAGRSRRCRHP